jgi:hypothetical protein
MKKTYNVMNRGSETSLVYLVASKCGLVGLIHWGIKVSLRPGSGISQLTDLDLPPAVCGARGSGPQRCYADNGGSCAIQEPWVLANHRDWEKNGKIDRAHIAIGAIVFCIVIAVGIVGLFFFYFFFEKKGNLTARMRRLGQLCFVASQPVVAVGVFGLLEKQMLICIFHIFGRSMTIKYFLITCKMWSFSSCVCKLCVC